MTRERTQFSADEDPAALFDDALDLAAIEDDAALADADDADFERDLHLLAAGMRHARQARRIGSR